MCNSDPNCFRMLRILTIISSLVAVSVSVYYPYPYPYYMPMVYYPLLRNVDNEMQKPQVEPIVVGLPNEEEFVCPGDGLFPDPNSGCKAYFNCQGEQVNNHLKFHLNKTLWSN